MVELVAHQLLMHLNSSVVFDASSVKNSHLCNALEYVQAP